MVTAYCFTCCMRHWIELKQQATKKVVEWLYALQKWELKRRRTNFQSFPVFFFLLESNIQRIKLSFRADWKQSSQGDAKITVCWAKQITSPEQKSNNQRSYYCAFGSNPDGFPDMTKWNIFFKKCMYLFLANISPHPQEIWCILK